MRGERRPSSHPRKPFGGIVEAGETQPAPVHKAEKEAAHASVRFVRVVQNAASAEIASGATEQEDRQLLGVVVAVQHAGTVHDGGVVKQGAFALLDL